MLPELSHSTGLGHRGNPVKSPTLMSNASPIEDFATAPGVTLQDTLDSLGMEQTELADRAGISQKTINRIVMGEEPITNNTALALEKVLRVPAHFWLNLESQYRAYLARE